jgi:hypothetical protein
MAGGQRLPLAGCASDSGHGLPRQWRGPSRSFCSSLAWHGVPRAEWPRQWPQSRAPLPRLARPRLGHDGRTTCLRSGPALLMWGHRWAAHRQTAHRQTGAEMPHAPLHPMPSSARLAQGADHLHLTHRRAVAAMAADGPAAPPPGAAPGGARSQSGAASEPCGRLRWPLADEPGGDSSTPEGRCTPVSPPHLPGPTPACPGTQPLFFPVCTQSNAHHRRTFTEQSLWPDAPFRGQDAGRYTCSAFSPRGGRVPLKRTRVSGRHVPVVRGPTPRRGPEKGSSLPDTPPEEHLCRPAVECPPCPAGCVSWRQSALAVPGQLQLRIERDDDGYHRSPHR